jgi:hypothetical protein
MREQPGKMSAAVFNNDLIIAKIMDSLEDDKASFRALMELNLKTVAVGLPRWWSSPSLAALANVPAEYRADIAAMARSIELNKAVTRSTAAALRNVPFRRLQKLVIAGAHPRVSLSWPGVAALTELHVRDSARSPAAQIALRLLPTNAKTLQVVKLSCAVRDNELAQLARIGGLRRLQLVGGLPSCAEIKAVAKGFAAAKNRPGLVPFLQLVDVVLAAPSSEVFALLKLVAVPTAAIASAPMSAPRSSLTVSFNDATTVDLKPVIDAYGNNVASGSSWDNSQAARYVSKLYPRPPLTVLRIEFPMALKLYRKHVLMLAQLPPTLRVLHFDSSREGNKASIPDLTDDDVVKIVSSQPNLLRFSFVVEAPKLTVAALNCLGGHCRKLRHVYLDGIFELAKLASPPSTTSISTTSDVDNIDKISTALASTAVAAASTSTSTGMVDTPPPQTAVAIGLSATTDTIRGSSATAAAAVHVNEPLFPELRSLLVEGTHPEHANHGMPRAAIAQAWQHPSHGERSRVGGLIKKADEAAARGTLAHILRHAPLLEDLLLLKEHGVNVIINSLWRRMHPGGCSTCGLHGDCSHVD